MVEYFLIPPFPPSSSNSAVRAVLCFAVLCCGILPLSLFGKPKSPLLTHSHSAPSLPQFSWLSSLPCCRYCLSQPHSFSSSLTPLLPSSSSSTLAVFILSPSGNSHRLPVSPSQPLPLPPPSLHQGRGNSEPRALLLLSSSPTPPPSPSSWSASPSSPSSSPPPSPPPAHSNGHPPKPLPPPPPSPPSSRASRPRNRL
jgi:hypothetical protein